MPDVAPRLETPRLILRRFEKSDVSAYLDLFSQAAVTAFLPALATRHEAFRQMAMVEGQWHLVGLSMFAVEERATGRMIGRAGPWMPDERNEPEIGWCIHPDVGGRGYAVEAAIACKDYLFGRFPGLTRIVHHIAPDNVPSQRTAIRLGAVKTVEVYTHPIAGPVEIWATHRPVTAGAPID